MGKETKIGLGIIAVLGVVFAAVLAQRLMGSKDTETAEAARPSASSTSPSDRNREGDADKRPSLPKTPSFSQATVVTPRQGPSRHDDRRGSGAWAGISDDGKSGTTQGPASAPPSPLAFATPETTTPASHHGSPPAPMPGRGPSPPGSVSILSPPTALVARPVPAPGSLQCDAGSNALAAAAAGLRIHVSGKPESDVGHDVRPGRITRATGPTTGPRWRPDRAKATRCLRRNPAASRFHGTPTNQGAGRAEDRSAIWPRGRTASPPRRRLPRRKRRPDHTSRRRLRRAAQRQLLGHLEEPLRHGRVLQGVGRVQSSQVPAGRHAPRRRHHQGSRRGGVGETYPDLCPSPERRQAVRQRASSVRGASTRLTGEGVYTVEEGDTLYDIARYKLGKGARWPEIYELNRDALQDNFDYLTPGMKLLLPDAPGDSGTVTRRPGTLNAK